MQAVTEVREKQRQLWNKFSGGWKRQDELLKRWAEPVNERLIEQINLKDGDTVLDVAAGTGEPGITIAQRYPQSRVIGTDIAEEMLAAAQIRAKEKALSNYETKVTDETSLPFDDASMDAVTCRFGVMFFPEPVDGVREMARVLRPGKRIALASWAELDKNPWFAVAAKTVGQVLDLPAPPSDAPGPFRHSQPGQLASLLNNCGFTDVTQKELQGRVALESREEYWEYITDIVAPIAIALVKADEQARKEAKDALLNAISNFEEDGKIVLPWSAWIASGEKLQEK